MTEVEFFAWMMVADAWWLLLIPTAVYWVALVFLFLRAHEGPRSPGTPTIYTRIEDV